MPAALCRFFLNLVCDCAVYSTLAPLAVHDAKRVGVLRHDVQGSRENASFQYDEAWLARPDRFALDPFLPLVAGPLCHR